MTRDERHERAVEAALAAFALVAIGGLREAIDAYLASLAEQGDPLVRVSEVVEWLRDDEKSPLYPVWMQAHAADAVQRRFAPGPEEPS